MKIALIAHNQKKPDMIALCIRYKDVLEGHELYATGTTGKLVANATNLKIKCMKSMIADSDLDLIIFLRDPLTAQPHEPDVNALLRLCDVTNTPLATNLSSAEIMLSALKVGAFVTHFNDKE